MEQLILFFLTFVVVFIGYEIFVVNRAKKNYKNKDKKIPIEIKYLIKKYGIDIKKINYFQLLQVVAIVSSLDITIIVTIMSLINRFIFKILFVVVCIIPIILISYSIVLKLKRNGKSIGMIIILLKLKKKRVKRHFMI